MDQKHSESFMKIGKTLLLGKKSDQASHKFPATCTHYTNYSFFLLLIM